MKRRMSDRLAPIVFVASVAILGILYGTAASSWGWFPAPQIKLAYQAAQNISNHWKNDLGLVPTRHLVIPQNPDRPTRNNGYRVEMPKARLDGYIAIAGLSPMQDIAAHMVTLYNDKGEVVYRWPVRYEALDPNGPDPLNVLLHGMEIFPDGSIAVTFDAGNVIARLDACGDTIWKIEGHFSHSIQPDGRGGLYALRKGPEYVRIDADTGEITSTLNLQEDIIALGEQRGYFDIRTRTLPPRKDPPSPGLPYLTDPFHANDVEPLLPSMADAFSLFEAGDLLISLRELNMIAVVDPETGRLKWWSHGPWIKQHDPDFQPNGTITVYDNATGSGSSKIRRVDPATGETETLFRGTEELPFYSWRRGKHQMLPNGNILITEAEHGRVMVVTQSGELVWSRNMVWDEERNLIVTGAVHLPPDFFTGGVPSCPKGGTANDTQ